MIHFLFGRSGSGKTFRILKEIRRLTEEKTRQVYLIVPEQQVYSAERGILPDLPPEAGRFFSIISFSRLCDLLGNRYGGRSVQAVTRPMKSLLMWENLRELSGILEAYPASSSADGSLCLNMLHAAEEFKLHAVSAAQLEQAAEHLESSDPLHGKLRDIALISSAFDGLLQEVYGENPSDRLMNAAAKLQKHDFFSGSAVFIDSFTSFTAQEYEMIREIFRQADDVTVSLCSDGRTAQEPQFESITDTARRLQSLCTDVGCPYQDTLLQGCFRTESQELQRLERCLWSFNTVAEKSEPIPAEEQGHIQLYEASGVYEEAQAAALHILELVEKGVPYRRIAVVVRDMERWKGILDATLDQYGIPFFLSVRTDLNEKPAARLLLSALRCVSHGFASQDVMEVCKTGLCGISPRDLDYFEEYVETWHISGKNMTEEVWNRNPSGYTEEHSPRDEVILEAANRVRRTVIVPLQNLELRLRTAERVEEEFRALYEYLQELHVRTQLAKQAEEYLRLGQVREAGEQIRLWQFLTETLAGAATVLGERDGETTKILRPDELHTALSLMFTETDIGSVPARYDCVTVGTADMLRVDDVSAMLVLGLCEGEFPQNVSSRGLLSEQEKTVLADLGIELDSRAERLYTEELLYVYRAMTQPSDTLILSRSIASFDGQLHGPSVAFAKVKALFPYLNVTRFPSSLTDGSADAPFTIPADDRLSPSFARELLGDRMYLSQSRLQTYAHCPYSYYGQMILKLREPTEAKLDNVSAGLFLHYVLEHYLKQALDEENRLRPLTEEEMKQTVDGIIQQYILEVCGNISGNGRLLRLFDRMRRVVFVLIADIQAELEQSEFRVAGLEWDAYGKEPTDPCPLVLSLNPDGTDDSDEPSSLPETDTADKPAVAANPVDLVLGGRIDRVDFFRSEDGETVYVRVIDYKSSKHDFTVKSLTEELNIQLLLYLFTMCSPENRRLFADQNGVIPETVTPAEMLYISPDETDKSGKIRPCRTGVIADIPEVLSAAAPHDDVRFLPGLSKSEGKGLTGKSLFSSERIAGLQRTLEQLIREMALEMYNGRAERTPSDKGCRYCIFRSHCALCPDLSHLPF